jgi:hypothetical protein
MNKKRYSQTPIHEYRIKYLTKDTTQPNYHYYMCEDANQALEFQMEMAKQKKWQLEILKIERFSKYSAKWEDESDGLTDENKFITKADHD